MAHPAACPAAVVRRPRPPSAHPGRGRGFDWPRHPAVDRHLLHQGSAVADLRGVASGFDVFRARTARAGHGLGGADRCQPRGRLHGSSFSARRAAADASRSAQAQGQHQPHRADHHRTARRDRCDDDAARGRLVLASSYLVRASLGAQPRGASAHRPRHQLHPRPCPADRPSADVGDAGARHRPMGTFRPVRAANGRVRHGDARPCLRALCRELSRAGETSRTPVRAGTRVLRGEIDRC